MSRQAGSMFGGIQSRAGYPSKRAGSRCRYVLRSERKVKVAGNWRGGQATGLATVQVQQTLTFRFPNSVDDSRFDFVYILTKPYTQFGFINLKQK